jgi:D-arabinitol 2-dehydrogenase
MFSRSLLRQATRVVAPTRPLAMTARNLSLTRSLRDSDDKPLPQEEGEHVGTFSRTDDSIEIPFDEKTVPKQEPVQGRGGFHFQRTLATFTLEGKTALVTGGARGLGLVMAQALVVSGADVAIVDLNSTMSFEKLCPCPSH